jgi:hypothetical protein
MKKSAGPALGLFLIASTAWSQAQPESNRRWVEQIDGSFSIPSSAAEGLADPGLGGDINIGYRFDPTFSFFIGTGYYQYGIAPSPGGQNAQLSYIPLTGILRFSFGEGPFHPYLVGGLGCVLNTYSQTNPTGSLTQSSSQSQINFYLAPGVGILYGFSNDMAVFLQSRVDLDFTSHNGLGGQLGNPSVFIPLQIGISFFAI